jgi:hypothetical protein
MKKLIAQVFVTAALLVVLICGIQSMAMAEMIYCSAACPVVGCDWTIQCKCDWNPGIATNCWSWACNEHYCPT